ncbi:TolC family protein [Herbaspirillum sp. SJZ107]|jgi:outer membrane protein TolC|uniref:TolC family protein n=1 Tax=Herbaspirillum sp. SJZ107 TaxID=2572881 RepID=UPI00117541BC|nr:TolC family protein [Herbaspirillum sp. SJZ107]TQK01248.1 outer membrane protein TolC [Herbaspirillum sp. SJZ107]
MHFLHLTRRRTPCRPDVFGSTLALAMLLCLALPNEQAAAASAGLTLVEAQQRALERSRTLPTQDAAIAAARELAVAAGRLPDPVLRAGIDNLPVSGSDRFNIGSDFMTMRRIGVMQELTASDKRRLRAAQLERTADKASAEKEVAIARVERETAQAWIDLYFAKQMADLVHQQVSQAQLDLEAAEAAYRAGKGSQGDVFAARGRIGAAQDKVSEFDTRVRTAQSTLARWTGPDVDVAPESLPSIDQVRLDPESIDSQLAHHPEIAVLDRQEEIARTGVQLAEANRHPDWSVEVSLQHRGQGYSNMLSVGVSVPLQWDRKNRQDRELAAKIMQADQVRDEREEMLRTHAAEVRVMLDEWRSGRERLARYKRELEPLALEQSAAVLAAYRGGKAALAEVLAARRNELEVRLQALQLAAETAKRWAQLNFLYPSGRSMPPSMNQSEARP